MIKIRTAKLTNILIKSGVSLILLGSAIASVSSVASAESCGKDYSFTDSNGSHHDLGYRCNREINRIGNGINDQIYTSNYHNVNSGPVEIRNSFGNGVYSSSSSYSSSFSSSSSSSGSQSMFSGDNSWNSFSSGVQSMSSSGSSSNSFSGASQSMFSGGSSSDIFSSFQSLFNG